MESMDIDSSYGKHNDLIGQADRSIQLLSSLQDDDDAFDIRRRIDYSDYSFSLSEIEHNESTQMEATSLSVQEGLLHVRVVLPDRTAEYIDIDPRITTIGKLKDSICEKRPEYLVRELYVVFEGRKVEDDWLVIDCGIQSDGTIHLIKRAVTFNEDTKSNSLFLSLSSAYAQEESIFQDEADRSMVSFDQSSNFQSAQHWEDNIRPEESSFYDAIIEYYETIPSNDANPQLELLDKYQVVCQERLDKLENHTAMRKRQSKVSCMELRLERNTWRLAFELLRHSVEVPGALTKDPRTEDEVISALESKDEIFRRYKTVCQWLESIATERIKFTNDTRKMALRTLALLRRSETPRGLVQHIDPDATIRENGFLEKDDAEDEMELLRSVWGYIRAGKIDDATELCIQLGQPWRAASISGGRLCGACEDVKENIDRNTLIRWGNPYRSLWKTMCWKMSEKDIGNSPSVEFEKAIYASLSGNTKILLNSPICKSWEDHCWIYFKAITDRKEEEAIMKFRERTLRTTKFCSGPPNLTHINQQLQRTSGISGWDASMVFDEIQTSKIPEVRTESESPYHQIQAKLIESRIDEIVTEVLFSHFYGSENVSWSLHLEKTITCDNLSPHMLRFGAHLILLFTDMKESFDKMHGYMIIKSYIRFLVKHSQIELIPLYASKLPDDGCIEVYSQFMQRVTEASQRQMCLRFAEKFFSPNLLPSITKLVVERSIQSESKSVISLDTSSATTTISKEDEYRMNSITWLCSYPSDRGEAIIQSNILMRHFVMNEKDNAAYSLFNKVIPEDSLAIIDANEQNAEKDDIRKAIVEHLAWKSYLNAKHAYSEWRSLTGMQVPELFGDEQRYASDIMATVSNAINALSDTLTFEHGWMVGINGEEKESSTVNSSTEAWKTDLRCLCLPTLVFSLHKVYFETAKKLLELRHHNHTMVVVSLLKRSLQVADLVADDHHKLYVCFTNEEMQQFLKLIHESTMAILAFENKLSV